MLDGLLAASHLSLYFHILDVYPLPNPLPPPFATHSFKYDASPTPSRHEEHTRGGKARPCGAVGLGCVVMDS